MLYAWVLAGLTICALLLAWLRLKAVGVAVSALLVILWLLGLRRHLQSPSILLYVLSLAEGGALFQIQVQASVAFQIDATVIGGEAIGEDFAVGYVAALLKQT